MTAVFIQLHADYAKIEYKLYTIYIYSYIHNFQSNIANELFLGSFSSLETIGKAKKHLSGAAYTSLSGLNQSVRCF